MNIVFGSGMYAVNHWKYIEKYFRPDCLISNSRNKWGRFTLGDLVCKSPEEVLSKNSEATKVLITVSDPEDISDIKCQLKPYDLEIQTIFEFIEENCYKESIPEKFLPLQRSHDCMFLLFNTAEHDNIGDHLISISEVNFLCHKFSRQSCVEISDIEYLWFHWWLKKCIKPTDIIFLTGGGFLGSLYLYTGEFAFRNLIMDYPNNPIITFPQTLFFEDNLRGKKIRQTSREVYSSHNNLVITLRESYSYNLAKGLSKNLNVNLIPDIALWMDYSKGNTLRGGKGINVCLRTDKESSITSKEREHLCKMLRDGSYNIFFTSMRSGFAINEKTRKEICKKKCEEILDSDLVITDTLHCMILCAITGTPCIAMDTISHKVSYVFDWISDLGYIKLAQNTQDIIELIEGTIALRKCSYPIENMRNYFSPLENYIKEAINLCQKNLPIL